MPSQPGLFDPRSSPTQHVLVALASEHVWSSGTARKGTVLDRKTVEAQQKDSAFRLTLLEARDREVLRKVHSLVAVVCRDECPSRLLVVRGSLAVRENEGLAAAAAAAAAAS